MCVFVRSIRLTYSFPMTLTDWAALLREPKAILGPYRGKAPPLATFAPHSWSASFDSVAIAGQFMQLPEQVPQSWGISGLARADVVFHFTEVRLLHVDGVLGQSVDDDSLHGNPCGIPGQCSLTATPDAFIDDTERGVFLPWKQFKFVQPAFSFLLEAGDVSTVWGRRAVRR
jgi:hypothetical protein